MALPTGPGFAQQTRVIAERCTNGCTSLEGLIELAQSLRQSLDERSLNALIRLLQL